ncbi:DUF5686 and carboxypeptidase regulatory-like domain-containing protein [Lunatibacter salilacus]|uniref:DUF5686 and carboxypeptidase regulatory-like domain-containing protein n=1 Tax=Lunatibacter salilacus TaxID=2483804 RepID=UPI00131B369E|nr:DUF5686 and carboxypeptidase regulatory-like domain-containing protein [Lunatibacter salilacus]
MRIKILILLSLILFLDLQTFAQGVRGYVRNERGNPLPFASIFIRNLGDGIPSNAEGYFQLNLKPGVYDVWIQFMGYESVLKTVEIDQNWVEVDFVLKEQMYALKEVTVDSKQEDPALTVMRRAIAKSDYHRLQVDSYSMKVYLKGTGKLTNAPFFVRKKLAEEGLNLNEAYTTESISEITFRQPNYLEEKVIAIRTVGEDMQTSPSPYIAATFYQDKVVDIISPLSKMAFSYYRFQFMGSFMDNGVLVNKIRVRPRSPGERVFDGYLYIIEDLWAIHSFDLETSYLGFQIKAKQQFAPIAENVWMPVTHTYQVSGKFFGFGGEFQYLASTGEYVLELNPDLIAETAILDEKVEELPADLSGFDKRESVTEQLAAAEQMSQKSFRKMIRTYEKQIELERENNEVVRERKYAVDSLATKRELNFWDSIRPVALTSEEIQGYRRDDSLARVESAKEATPESTDTSINKKFQVFDVLGGGDYFFGRGLSAGFYNNAGKKGFNSVEGFKFGLAGYLRYRKREKLADSVNFRTKQVLIRPEGRYGLSSKTLYGRLAVTGLIRNEGSHTQLSAEGGRFIFQLNREEPISEWVNSAYTLLLSQNWMKLYEQRYLRVDLERQVSAALTVGSGIEYAERTFLENTSSYSFREGAQRRVTSNRPGNSSATKSGFSDHRLYLWRSHISWRPGLKYSIRNNRKSPLYSTAPHLTLAYNKGIPVASANQSSQFDQLEANFRHAFSFGVSGKLDINLTAGSFLNRSQVYFMDFKHFGGNRTIFTSMGAASEYRLLDYYRFSTDANYIGGILHYQFRKFLFTQLPMLRFTGVRENIFFNYLKTDTSPHYMEIGYSLDNLWRIFRVEFAAGFENGAYVHSGPRFGIATFITISSGE